MAAEKQFENKVKKYLEGRGCWILKYWGGAAYTKSGIPDLLVCANRNFIGVELKAPNGEPSLLQLYHLDKIRKAKGYGILLYPKDFENFKGFMEDPTQGNSWYLDNIEEQYRWKIKLEQRREKHENDQRRTD